MATFECSKEEYMIDIPLIDSLKNYRTQKYEKYYH